MVKRQTNKAINTVRTIKDKTYKGMKMGTWNASGIFDDGVARNLEEEDAMKHKLDIFAVQETHIKKHQVKLEEYNSKSGGHTRKFGVDFLVSRDIKHKITEYVPDRLCYIGYKERDKYDIVECVCTNRGKIGKKRVS